MVAGHAKKKSFEYSKSNTVRKFTDKSKLTITKNLMKTTPQKDSRDQRRRASTFVALANPFKRTGGDEVNPFSGNST
jgi:hypothetical protein